jgi:integrase
MVTGTEKGRTARLSKSAVDGAKPAAARYIIWDSRLTGFGLRVEPGGIKTYIVRYRLGSGGRKAPLRQLKVGRVGDPKLTPDEAYRQAHRRLAEAKTGGDPQGERAKQRAEITVATLCDEYEAEDPAGKKASTRKIDKVRIARHIKPVIGKLRASEVTQADVERVKRAVESGKIKADATNRTRGGPSAAARTVGLLQGLFNYAIDRKLVSENPAHGVKRAKDRERATYLTPAEISTLSDALTEMAVRDADAERAIGNLVTEQHSQVIRLLLLSGARKNEVVRLRWSEVDLDTGFLRLADSKTGQKNIPLGAGARALLAGLTAGDSEWVFPDPRDPKRPVRNIDYAWACIRARAGLTHVRIHDLRHTFASIGLMGGQSLAFIAKLLGHTRLQSTQRYAHLSDDPVRAAADSISATIGGALAGKHAEQGRS